LFIAKLMILPTHTIVIYQRAHETAAIVGNLARPKHVKHSTRWCRQYAFVFWAKL